MKCSNTRARLLASSMITGATLLAAGGAFAQTDAGTTVGEVVVTGSRIPHPNLTTASPVTTVTAQQIKLQGTVNVEDFINNLPQAFAGQGQYLANGATGTATVNLRGLGSERTMVLIDGKRLMPGDATDPVPDINFIPPALIDHVDVLTGGASAVYGSDAVAGVVNFVMKKNFTGLQIDAETSVAESSSNNDQVRRANTFSHNSFLLPLINLPSKDEWDGQRDTVTITGGANSPDNKGNVEFYFGKTTITAVNEGDRDYSACSLATNNTNTHQQYCGGSSTSNITLFQPTGKTVAAGGTVPNNSKFAVGPGGSLSAFGPGDDYNYAPYNYFQRPDTRYTAGEFSTYNINSHVNLYSSFMFLDDHTVAAIAPSGSFNGDNAYTIPCNDPLLSTAEQTALCGPGVTTGTETANIAHRNVDGGAARTSDIEHMDYRIVFGAKGDITDGWSYDASAQYGRTVLTDIEGGYFSNAHLKNALDVIPNPAAGATGNIPGVAAGAPVCSVASTGADTKCVPYNIFTTGAVTPAQLAYLETTAESSGTTTEQVYTINITGDLGKYGVKSPWADKAAGVNFGFEYRSENLQTSYDEAIEDGDLAGAGGSTLPTSGTQADKDVFGELSIPLVENMPFAKEITFDTGYRYSDYTSGGGNSTYKFELDWQTTGDLMFRGSYERAVRAPNVQELFLPATPGLVGGSDPCAAGATATITAAQCYNTYTHSLPGLTMNQFLNGGYVFNGQTLGPIYGTTDPCPAAQCGSFSGGNPNLKPETADTFSYGLVFTPTFFRGFSLTVDYFNIDVKQAIVSVPFTTIFANCALLGNASDCNNIDRFQGTNFGVFGGEGLGEVNQPLLNASALKTSGVDVEAQYHFRLADYGMGDMGSLTFVFNGTYLNNLTTVLPDGTQYDCAGLFGVTCGAPSPKWRHTLRVSWNTPWNLTLEAAWRHYGPATLDFNTNQGPVQNFYKDLQASDQNIPSFDYMDLAFSYKFKDRYTVRGGMNNVFDKTPPLVDANSFGISGPPFGNGNTYPQVYDPLGRVMFLGITADF